MKILRPIAMVAICLTWTAGAVAQISLTPPGAETPTAKPAATDAQTSKHTGKVDSFTVKQ